MLLAVIAAIAELMIATVRALGMWSAANGAVRLFGGSPYYVGGLPFHASLLNEVLHLRRYCACDAQVSIEKIINLA
jgi:hypothetical protein